MENKAVTYYAVQRVKGKKWIAKVIITIYPGDETCLRGVEQCIQELYPNLKDISIEWESVSRQKNYLGVAQDCKKVEISKEEYEHLSLRSHARYYFNACQGDKETVKERLSYDPERLRAVLSVWDEL